MKRNRLFLCLLFLIPGMAGNTQGTYRSLKDAAKEPEKVFTLELIQSRPKAKRWEEFSRLENLNKLYIEDLLLDTLPASMSGLVRMSEFRSKRTPIERFPDTLKSWRNLSYLELVQAELDSFPKICPYWGKLREIGIDRNRSEELVLPDAIGKLHELRLLAINASPLAPLPRSITELSQLHKLILKDCELEEVPRELGKLDELRMLVLEENELQRIPSSIRGMGELEHLSLKGNLLERLPESISALTSLERLDIRDNYFSAYQLDIIKALLPDTEILHDPIEDMDG